MIANLKPALELWSRYLGPFVRNYERYESTNGCQRVMSCITRVGTPVLGCDVTHYLITRVETPKLGYLLQRTVHITGLPG